jgi:ligand-binding sensor domain-containing protein
MLLGLTPLLLFAAGVRADVVEPDRTIFQYKHSHWSVADGAPPGIYALAQGRDGFLWVGSLNGLYRFDGIAFEQISGADGQAGGVSALLSATDGTVWIGYNSGEIATYARGNLRRDRSAPKTDAYVMNLVQTQDGAIWAALGRPDHALLRRSNGRWEEIGPDWGLPQEWLIDTFVARDGSLWVTTTQSILVLRKGARRFERAGTPAGHSAISEDPAGIIWLSDDRGTQILFAPRSGARTGRAFPTPRATRNFRTRFDRQGNLWGVNGDGLFRLRSQAANQSMRGRAAAQVEHFTQNDGLTSSRTVSVLEDREGSVWIGTSLGLDQFRLTNVVPEPSLKSFPMWGIVLLGASDGSVYIGTADGIYRAAPGATPQPLVRHFPDPQAICEGPKGTIWVFGRNQLLRIRGGRVMRLNPPPADDTGFEGCAVDRRNVLWVNVGRDGLLSFASAKWKQSPVGARGDRALLLTPDRQGRVLILLRSGALIRLTDDGQPRPVLLRRDISDASMIAAVGRGLLIGGPFGLGRVDGGQLRLADSRRFSWLARPTGIVETAKGQLWLITARGIAGISATDLEQGFGDARAGLRPTLLSFDDGLPNIQSGAPSSAAQGGDGRVWFSTLGGAVWIDPAHFIRNVLSPP